MKAKKLIVFTLLAILLVSTFACGGPKRPSVSECRDDERAIEDAAMDFYSKCGHWPVILKVITSGVESLYYTEADIDWTGDGEDVWRLFFWEEGIIFTLYGPTYSLVPTYLAEIPESDSVCDWHIVAGDVCRADRRCPCGTPCEQRTYRISQGSPDGSKITFYSDRDGNYEVYVMDADGSNQTRLTNNPAGDGFPSCPRCGDERRR